MNVVIASVDYSPEILSRLSATRRKTECLCLWAGLTPSLRIPGPSIVMSVSIRDGAKTPAENDFDSTVSSRENHQVEILAQRAQSAYRRC